MPFDVYLQRPPFRERPAEDDILVCRIQYDGTYLFLLPFLPQSSSNGLTLQRAMSSEEEVLFTGANLAQLRGCLERARGVLDGRPPRWSVSLGPSDVRGEAKPRERRETLDRERLRAWIDGLVAATVEAEGCQGRLLFEGT
jgi:hypothetical protein